ncbi:MAG: hypothetical protein QXY49_01715 [Thermofilaceae archaeon]
MAVDETLVALAEVFLMVGLFSLALRLWNLKYDCYPELVAKAINSSPTDAEIIIILPKPVAFKVSDRGVQVCQAGECYITRLHYAKGSTPSFPACIKIMGDYSEGCDT